jgi:hypothetical protein
MKGDATDSSPATAAVEEIDRIRAALREALTAYGNRLDHDFAAVREIVTAQTAAPKIPSSKMRDLRDILTLLRTLEIKPDKGRRKDIKKLDGLAGDLRMLVERW